MRHKAVGILPTQTWLRNHNHAGLADAIDRCPKAFAHIPQAKRQPAIKPTPLPRISKLQASVTEAEQLAKVHGGRLPCPGWLIANGYKRLYGAMWRHPESFRHIPRDRKHRTKQDWVTLAEDLTAKYGGVLPDIAGLFCAMRNHPDLFAHLKP